MIDTIYIEGDVREHPRTATLLARFAGARQIPCDHYGEIFNRRRQNFRIQKRRPALILAKKHGNRVLSAPAGFGVGGLDNFYFSHMYNCLYDCRYCFLQGMYPSAHYLLFVNYEDFFDDIEQTAATHPGAWFFSGYDCDSLALEPVTGFVESCLPRFAAINGWLELRTKSTQVRKLLDRRPLENCVVAFSLSPEPVVGWLEARTPRLSHRLAAAREVAARGWQVGLRFDPVVPFSGAAGVYEEFFAAVFASVPARAVHSVSLGSFRMPRDYFKQLARLYPAEPLFAAAVPAADGTVGCAGDAAAELLASCHRALREHVPGDRIFHAGEDHVPATSGGHDGAAAVEP